MPDMSQERARLIDHFKRAYQVIVGLAIAVACSKLFPQGLFQKPDITFWSFCTFFITVVPIFHGGDRSLDLKYLSDPPIGFWRQASYVWDVYMLLITAILFVKIAQAIPGAGSFGFGGGSAPRDLKLFYEWMAGMLVFDVMVLIVDWGKTGLLRLSSWADLQVYWIWIVVNLMLAFLCYSAAFQLLWLGDLEPAFAAILILGAAFVRTLADYCLASKFLFP